MSSLFKDRCNRESKDEPRTMGAFSLCIGRVCSDQPKNSHQDQLFRLHRSQQPETLNVIPPRRMNQCWLLQNPLLPVRWCRQSGHCSRALMNLRAFLHRRPHLHWERLDRSRSEQ